MTALLYLDLDGVVHHQAVQWHPVRGIHVSQSRALGHALFEWVLHLEKALEPHPQVRLVLSSSWGVRPSYAKTLDRLPSALRARFVGGTFNRGRQKLDSWGRASFESLPRCEQIEQDVTRRRPANWLAIDDDIDDWPHRLCSHLVECEGNLGLSSPLTQKTLGIRLEWLASPGTPFGLDRV